LNEIHNDKKSKNIFKKKFGKLIDSADHHTLLPTAVVDSRDFLPISFLEKGNDIQRCVAKVSDSEATGFLISPSLFITNNHVLRSREAAIKSTFEFNYQNDIDNQPKPICPYYSKAEIFYTNPWAGFDYTIVKLTGKPGEKWGYVSLINDACPQVGNNCIMIQHPDGRRKEIVLHNSVITDINPEGLIQYTTDSEAGSSGSPVFDIQWRVVALHYDHGDIVYNQNAGKPIWKNNKGLLVSTIIKNLKLNDKDDDVKQILKELEIYEKI
jgi:V8-like Glu-specific endopeptidase